MSIRAKVTVMAVTAAACVLLAPAAMASTHGPVQVTGKQLKSALLPASAFLAGYTAGSEHDSGRTLNHGSTYNLPTMSCHEFWLALGIPSISPGFGQTAYAGDIVGTNSTAVSVFEVFQQAVYQFASTHAASSFLGGLNAKYRSCPSVSVPDTKGGTLRWTVRSRSTQHVGGHRALQLAQNQTDSTVPDGSIVIDALWTVDGTDVYMISSDLVTGTTAQPTLSSLTLKLIPRVTALR
jgi:hypothetical protein